LNPGWVGAVIGIVGVAIGIAVSYVFYRLALRDPLLASQASGVRVLERSYPVVQQDLTIAYRGQPISRLTSTVIVVWNAGRKTIQQGDLVEKDPLRFEWDDDAQILDVRIARVSREAIDFRVSRLPEKASALAYSFDFLDQRDGARIVVLHTGKSLKPRLAGSVRGLRAGCRDWGYLRSAWPARMAAIPFGITAVLGLLSVLLGLYGSRLPQRLSWLVSNAQGQPTDSGAMIVVGVLMMVMLPVLSLFTRSHPQELYDPVGWAEIDRAGQPVSSEA
jgi:hypothetical protein